MRTNDPRVRIPPPNEPSCPSALELAAFCDGRLDDDATLRVGLHLDACEPCRGTCLGLDESHADSPVRGAERPSQAREIERDEQLRQLDRIVARASALVSADAPASIPFPSPKRYVRRGLAAAAMLAASLSGWWVGARLGSTTLDRTDAAITVATAAPDAGTDSISSEVAMADAETTTDETGTEEMSSVMLVTFGLMDVEKTNGATTSPGSDES